MARASAYLLLDAMTDYRIEHGDLQASAVSIAARLKHVTDYLEANQLLGTTCADAARKPFANAFRAWSRKEPVRILNGKRETVRTRPRAPATTEESLVQLGAALRHAVDQNRADNQALPSWSPLGRKKVTRPRVHRIDEAMLARMLTYAAEPNEKRNSLHAFLVASICTLARPDTIFDISTDPKRDQWFRGSPILHLNPLGRVQTNKGRATIPVLPPLRDWLNATVELAEDDEDPTGGWLVNYYGRPVSGVGTAWDSMLDALGLPQTREFKPYVLRHSLATLCRARGVNRWELKGYMGHNDPDPIEIYAVATIFPTVTKALTDILAVIEELAPGTLRRNCAGAAPTVIPLMEKKMTG